MLESPGLPTWDKHDDSDEDCDEQEALNDAEQDQWEQEVAQDGVKELLTSSTLHLDDESTGPTYKTANYSAALAALFKPIRSKQIPAYNARSTISRCSSPSSHQVDA